MLAQLGGQGRLAVGAILGAATSALCLLSVSTGDGTMAAPDNPFPLAVNAGPTTTTTGPQVRSTTIPSTGPTTVAASTTARPTSSAPAPTSAPPTDSVVLTSDPPQPTTVPTTERQPPPTTVRRTTRPRPTPTQNPCWFIFC